MAELTLALSEAVAAFVARWIDSGSTPASVIAVAIDCHPWSGHLEVALLGREAAREDPLLLAPTEIAAWDGFEASAGDAAWKSATSALREQMKRAYDGAAPKERASVATDVLTACAASCLQLPARAALERLASGEASFVVYVTHPDSDRAFLDWASRSLA